MPLQTSVSTDNGTAVITLEGDLDANTAPDFERDMQQVTGQGLQQLVLDVRKLDYLSSAGLRQLVFAQQKLADDVRIVVVGANPRVLQTIKLVGFDQSVTLTDRLPA